MSERKDLGTPGLARDEEKTLKAFQALMLEKLRKNAHKGGWRFIDPYRLFERLKDEVAELGESLNASTTNAYARQCTAREAADVANFAMMVADAVGGLEEPDLFFSETTHVHPSHMAVLQKARLDFEAPAVTAQMEGDVVKRIVAALNGRIENTKKTIETHQFQTARSEASYRLQAYECALNDVQHILADYKE